MSSPKVEESHSATVMPENIARGRSSELVLLNKVVFESLSFKSGLCCTDLDVALLSTLLQAEFPCFSGEFVFLTEAKRRKKHGIKFNFPF